MWGGGRAEEGGEGSGVNTADTVEKLLGRDPESAGVHLPSRPVLQAPGLGSVVHA